MRRPRPSRRLESGALASSRGDTPRLRRRRRATRPASCASRDRTPREGTPSRCSSPGSSAARPLRSPRTRSTSGRQDHWRPRTSRPPPPRYFLPGSRRTGGSRGRYVPPSRSPRRSIDSPGRISEWIPRRETGLLRCPLAAHAGRGPRASRLRTRRGRGQWNPDRPPVRDPSIRTRSSEPRERSESPWI